MSGSSRRQDSSDASSAPSVANLIDENDVYRIGYPAPLEALPLETGLLTSESSLIEQYRLLKTHIQSILTARGVRWTAMSPTLRYPLQKVPPHRCTIHIDATKGDNDDAVWSRALHECVQVLLINKALDFGIEIQDPRSVKHFYTPVCGPEVYHSWNNVLRPRVLETLQLDGWLAMTILRYGHEEARSPLAIVISTREDSTRDWAHVKRQIEDILNSSSYHFEIVFIRDSVRAMMGLPRATVQSPSAFSGPVNSGASIGPAGKQSSATLGGYIKCRSRRDGLVKEFGLTNTHVVMPTDVTDGKVDVVPSCYQILTLVLEEERKGIPEGHRAASIIIVSPGELDTQRTIDSYHDNITTRETVIQELEFKLNMGGEDERYRPRIDHNRSQVTKAVNECQMVRNGSFEFGKLLCSSGYSSIAGTTVVNDWALIDVKWPRLGLTFVSSCISHTSYSFR